jgi:hypothetical protein
MPDASQSWVLLVYTLPREPSAPRVAIWRKLKKLGAILAHDAVWTLPNTAATREQVRWLAQEVREAGGEAQVWMAYGDLPGQDDALIARFLDQAERGYQELLHALEASARSRTELARVYRAVRTLDYFHAPSGDLARARLATPELQPGVDHVASEPTRKGAST